jgi:MFS family permease
MENDKASVDISQHPPEKMRWLYVLAIGLGFFTTGISWGVYNSYLPADFLPTFITGAWQNTIIGAIMVMDNILALFMQPYISARSDKVRTRMGRRMPFVMIGTPFAAAFFFLIAYGWTILNFWAMFAFLTAFNVSMAFYRAPVVALMPDLVPSVHRSKANGVINLMGGIGSIYAFAVASRIYKIQDPGLAAMFGVGTTQIGPILAFLSTSIIMVIAVLILYKAIKEPPLPPVDQEKPKEIGIIQAFRLVSLSKEKSARAILAAIFFWFLAYNSIETWFTKYGKEVLGFATADASFLFNGIAISFVIFAVPAGFAAGKVGRRNAILTGLVIMLASLSVLWFLTSYLMIMAILAVAGLGWALVNVNSIVMVWELLGKARLGAGTGLYYVFSTSAAIVGPFVAGVIFDFTSIRFLFPISIVFLVIALLITLRVKLGEVGDEAKSEVAQ